LALLEPQKGEWASDANGTSLVCDVQRQREWEVGSLYDSNNKDLTGLTSWENEMVDNDVKKGSKEVKLPERLKHAEKKLEERLKDAMALKDYAVESNIYVDDSIMKRIDDAYYSDQPLMGNATESDTALRDLTEATFPTTAATLRSVESKGGTERFASGFMAISLIAGVATLVFAIYSISQAPLGDEGVLVGHWHAIIAACLGFLGSLVYIFFNLIGVMAERAFDARDSYANAVRLVLGAIVGWVFFYTFAAGKTASPYLLMLPFLAGFSTRLVVGLLNQAIRSVELTLGLEDVGSRISRRRSKDRERR
jgi:hypothetical protein